MIATILRKMPSFKGKQRLASWLLKKQVSTLSDIVVKGKYGCVYKIPNIRENIGFDIYINGLFEEDTIHFILNNTPRNGILIDIGANIGSITIPVCKLRSDIKAICIEASPRVYSYLEFNKESNQANNCSIVNMAVTDTDAQVVNFYSPVEKFGKGSLSSVFTSNAERVETITLDTLLEQKNIDQVDFMKVDIEGYEYFAFRGAKRILSRSDAPDILFEFLDWAEKEAKDIQPGAAQQILLEYGYKLFVLSKNNKKKQLFTPLNTGAAMILATKK
jgi:FkbM family methyltransferase